MNFLKLTPLLLALLLNSGNVSAAALTESTIIPAHEAQKIQNISLSHAAWDDTQKVQQLFAAVCADQFHVCKYLLEHVLDDFDISMNGILNFEENIYLHSIYVVAQHSANNQDQYVRLFQGLGLSIENNGYAGDKLYPSFRILKRALKEGKFEEMVELLQFDRFESLILYAFSDRSSQFLNKLVDLGVNFGGFVDSYGCNALMAAINMRDYGLAKRIMPHMTRINAKDNQGRTALDLCLLDGTASAELKPMIEKRGGVYGSLRMCYQSADKKSVRKYLKAGGDPNEMTEHGPIIFLFLLDSEYVDVARLIKAGADVNGEYCKHICYPNLLAAAYKQAKYEKRMSWLNPHKAKKLYSVINMIAERTENLNSYWDMESDDETEVPKFQQIITTESRKRDRK